MWITAHLPAHLTAKGLKLRNHTYHQIDQKLRLCCESVAANKADVGSDGGSTTADAVQPLATAEIGPSSAGRKNTTRTGNGSCLSDRFDGVFWMGDLNYRINGNREAVEKLLASNDLTTLRANDQLAQARSAKEAFSGYDEGWLGFRPTYKFDKTRCVALT